MKIMISVLFIICMSCTVLFSQPVIEIGNPIIDLGELPQHTVQNFVIFIKNKGTKNLVINDVIVSCSCTTVSIAEKNIKPGGQTEVIAAFNSKSYKGDISRIIKIASNDKKNPEVNVLIKTRVVKTYLINPEVLILNDIVKRYGYNQQVRLWHKDHEKIYIDKIDYNKKLFNIDYTANKNGNEITFDITIKKDLSVANFSEKVTVYFKKGKTKYYTFYVNGFVHNRDIKTKPPFIKINKNSKTVVFDLLTRSGKDFTIKKVVNSHKELKLNFSKKNPGIYTVTITLDRDKVKKERDEKKIDIITDYKDEETYELNITY